MNDAQPRPKASTGAIAVVLAAVASLVVGLSLFPLAIAMAAVTAVLSVRALRRRPVNRGWYTAGLVISTVSLALAVAGWVLVSSQ